jgi:hypothetical protein
MKLDLVTSWKVQDSPSSIATFRAAIPPSVHNKFVVERNPATKKALRVLTGSTNWTVTGLCTQLNNVLIVQRRRSRNASTTSGTIGGSEGRHARLARQTNAKGPKTARSLGFGDRRRKDLAPVLDAVERAKSVFFSCSRRVNRRSSKES